MPLTLSGAEAVIRLDYHVAASVGAWTITTGENGGLTLSGSIVHANHYRLSQRPLVFVMTRPGAVCRWPILELQIQGASISATLGPRS